LFFNDLGHFCQKSKKDEVQKLLKFSRRAQVEKILKYYDEQNPIGSKKGFYSRIVTKLEKIREKYFGISFRRAAIAVASTGILIFGGSRAFLYYNTSHQIVNAKHIMHGHYRTHFASPRLSGGYAPARIGSVLSGDEQQSTYLENAKTKLNRAFAHGSTSLEAYQLMLQIFILEEDYERVDSLLAMLKNHSNKVAILNDIGVYYYRKGYLARATEKFQSALAADSSLLETYYNLALVKLELNAPEEALSLLKDYLRREASPQWKDAARDLIAQIESNAETPP
jgi:tetratricopeptide (TPR) repeat protein